MKQIEDKKLNELITLSIKEHDIDIDVQNEFVDTYEDCLCAELIEILARYIYHVGECEGVTFLSYKDGMERHFTEEQREFILNDKELYKAFNKFAEEMEK